jgi:hypothetical protein
MISLEAADGEGQGRSAYSLGGRVELRLIQRSMEEDASDGMIIMLI